MPSRITVAAYFYFDGKSRKDSLGNTVTTDWNWAVQQFDRVAAAGPAVRSVVVDQAYVIGMPDPANPTANSPNASDVRNKLQLCRTAGQLIYGYVACSGGAIPLHAPANPSQTWWQATRDSSKWWTPLTGPVASIAPQTYPGVNSSYPCVKEQIDLWYNLYSGYIDGIYVDEGPTDCLTNQVLGWSNIPVNYADYCQYIHSRNQPNSATQASVYLLAAGYGDVDSNKPGWFGQLSFDEVSVWEQAVDHYMNHWAAVDFCTLNANGEPSSVNPPAWWDPGSGYRAHREHFINNGVLQEASATGNSWAQVLCSLIGLADGRGADTIWITETQSSAHGSVYGFLPPYWDAEVALCTPPPP